MIADDPNPPQSDMIKKIAEAQLLLHAGEKNRGEALFATLLAHFPQVPEPHFFWGAYLLEQGRVQEALATLHQALTLKPDSLSILKLLAYTFAQTGALDEAETYCQKLLQLQPQHGETLALLAGIYALRRRPHLAIPYCEKAMAAGFEDHNLWNNYGSALAMVGQLDAACRAFSKACQLDPTNISSLFNKINILSSQGNIAQALTEYQKILAKDADKLVHWSNYLCHTLYSDQMDAAAIFNEHRRFGEKMHLTSLPFVHQNNRDPTRTLQVGLVSSDLRDHSVAFFIFPLLQNFDHACMQITCYAQVVNPDHVTTRIQGLLTPDHWRSIVGLSDREVATIIYDDQIDILIDLNGHMALNRLGVFALKPAPIQLTWIGYPTTTGLATIDYRLTDAFADPPETADPYYTEQLLRLEDSFLCYHPILPTPRPNSSPWQKNGYMTFGSFNNPKKISPTTLQDWVNLLQAVPHSRLLLKGKTYIDENFVQHMRQQFSQLGLSEDRLSFAVWESNRDQHLQRYHDIDIALDTYPFNGVTTTCEALWMGVPVLTRMGDHHVARVAADILRHVGLLDLCVACNAQQWVKLGTILANKQDMLANLRFSLRDRMQRSPIGNDSLFARKIEQTFRTIWQQWCHSTRS